MRHRGQDRVDAVPQLPALLVATGECWRAVRDVQAAVDPGGPSYAALEAVRMAVEALAHHLTGQRGFLALAEPVAAAAPQSAGEAS